MLIEFRDNEIVEKDLQVLHYLFIHLTVADTSRLIIKMVGLISQLGLCRKDFENARVLKISKHDEDELQETLNHLLLIHIDLRL